MRPIYVSVDRGLVVVWLRTIDEKDRRLLRDVYIKIGAYDTEYIYLSCVWNFSHAITILMPLLRIKAHGNHIV